MLTGSSPRGTADPASTSFEITSLGVGEPSSAARRRQVATRPNASLRTIPFNFTRRCTASSSLSGVAKMFAAMRRTARCNRRLTRESIRWSSSITRSSASSCPHRCTKASTVGFGFIRTTFLSLDREISSPDGQEEVRIIPRLHSMIVGAPSPNKDKEQCIGKTISLTLPPDKENVKPRPHRVRVGVDYLYMCHSSESKNPGNRSVDPGSGPGMTLRFLRRRGIIFS